MRTYFFSLRYQYGITIAPIKNRTHQRKLAGYSKHAVKTAIPGLNVEYVFFCADVPDQSQVNKAVSDAADLILAGQEVYFEDSTN